MLPAKIVGGYWEYYGSVALKDVPTGYNVVFWAFAKGADKTSGKLVMPATNWSTTQIKADITTLKNRGTTVILSIGGWNDVVGGTYGWTLNTQVQIAAAVASLKTIITDYGFQGIDWDLEHTLYPASIVDVTKQLKAWKSDLLVTMAPMRSLQPTYESIASSLGADFNLIGPQYYNRGLSEAASLNDIVAYSKTLASKFGTDRVMIGTMQADDSGVAGDTNDTVTIQTCKDAWSLTNGIMRGEYVWAIGLDKDRNYQFVNQVGPVVMASAGTTTPPPTTTTPPPTTTPPTTTTPPPTTTTTPPANTTDGTVKANNSSYPLAGTNITRLTDQLVRYTRAKYTTSPANRYGAEATVVDGKVTKLVDRSVGLTDPGAAAIPTNGVVLSGHGKAKTWLLTNAKVGNTIAMPA